MVVRPRLNQVFQQAQKFDFCSYLGSYWITYLLGYVWLSRACNMAAARARRQGTSQPWTSTLCSSRWHPGYYHLHQLEKKN